jgi:chromate transport protein ChrA
MQCSQCSGTGQSAPGVRCSQCGMHLGKEGIKVEGSDYKHVLIVAASLIVLVFILAVIWRLIFG